MRVERFTTADTREERLLEIRRLLRTAFGGGFSDADWEHTLGGWHVVVTDNGAVVAHAAVVARGLTVAGRPFRVGYVEGVATDPTRREEGLGTQAMAELSGLISAHFEMGALSTHRHDFYARLGWERWRGPTYVQDGGVRIRTEAEDDGIMVLRFGPSAHVRLTSPITCEARIGDDW